MSLVGPLLVLSWSLLVPPGLSCSVQFWSFPGVNVALYDGVEGGLVDAAGLHSQEAGLEEGLGHLSLSLSASLLRQVFSTTLTVFMTLSAFLEVMASLVMVAQRVSADVLSSSFHEHDPPGKGRNIALHLLELLVSLLQGLVGFGQLVGGHVNPNLKLLDLLAVVADVATSKDRPFVPELPEHVDM